MPYNESLWSLRYPELASIDTTNGLPPLGNTISTDSQ